jgi:hypothetical protein
MQLHHTATKYLKKTQIFVDWCVFIHQTFAEYFLSHEDGAARRMHALKGQHASGETAKASKQMSLSVTGGDSMGKKKGRLGVGGWLLVSVHKRRAH